MVVMASDDHTNTQNVDKNEIFPILSQKETLFTISLGLEKKETQREEMHCLQQTALRERRKEQGTALCIQEPEYTGI